MFALAKAFNHRDMIFAAPFLAGIAALRIPGLMRSTIKL